VNDSITSRLAATSKQKIEGNGILATQLCSHTNDANSINESKLENLEGDKILFKADDSDAGMTKTLDQQIQAPSQLYLKVNAQVMLLKNINISNGLVNGARGVVVRMDKDLPVVRFKNNQEYVCKHEKWIIKTASGGLITRRQVPLKLAWAFSIHKSQGLTLDCVAPVTTAEMILARKKAGLMSKGSVTTPSPQAAKKRRFEELKEEKDRGSLPAAKKLYQSTTDESLRLSEEQMEVLRACTSGKSVFFTGSAGTGKSFLLRRIISALPPDGTVATASTGVAACLIGGTTLHAFAGIGGGDATMQRCLELASRPASAQTWRKCKRLIIDEISMVDGQFFEVLLPLHFCFLKRV